MKARVLKIEKHDSKLPDKGSFYYIFFKGIEDCKSYRSCIYEKFRNFQNWKAIIQNNNIGLLLDNLVAQGNLINADSIPKIIREEVGADGATIP